MSSGAVLLCLLVSSSCSLFAALDPGEFPAARETLRPGGAATSKVRLPITKRIYNAGPDEKEKEGVGDKVVKELKKPVDAVAKVMSNPIDAMRGELCMSRANIIGHSKCMDWLVEECTTKSFGTGLCKRVRAHVKKECQGGDDKACEYAKLLGIDVRKDTDGDGVPDEEDAFPKDPKETKDTDGDGVGDNEDEYPNDPACTKKPCKESTTTTKKPPEIKVAAAPAPSVATAAPAAAKKEELATPAAKEEPKEEPKKEEPAKAPAPAPKKEEAKKEEPVKQEPAPAKEEPAKEEPAKKEPANAPAAAEPAAAPSVYQEPNAKQPLQSQGFSGDGVIHEDMKTATAD